jgi:hypothetical protein
VLCAYQLTILLVYDLLVPVLYEYVPVSSDSVVLSRVFAVICTASVSVRESNWGFYRTTLMNLEPLVIVGIDSVNQFVCRSVLLILGNFLAPLPMLESVVKCNTFSKYLFKLRITRSYVKELY